MVSFSIKQYTANGDIMLVRIYEAEKPSKGLPPITSQTILMSDNELIKLREVIDGYQRRNVNLQHNN